MNEVHLQAERIERAALTELHAAASGHVHGTLGLRLEQVGGTLVSIAANEPSILLNRAIGLGVETPATAAAVFEVRRLYAGAGVGRFFLHVHPHAKPAELRAWLGAEGLRPHRRWMKFVRGRDMPPETVSDLRVEKIWPEHADHFGRIVAQGFDLTEAAVPMLAGLVHRPGWHLYLSLADDQPVGAGAMYVQDGIAHLDWGATLPAFRERGSQRTVLARRVRDALDLGCELMVTTTGEAVPGDPQHSYRNIEWAGFEPAYLRDNFVLVA